MSGARRELRLLNAAAASLIEAAFHTAPNLRMGFDEHVRAWRTAVGRECWVRYWNNAEFAAAYDARLTASRRAA